MYVCVLVCTYVRVFCEGEIGTIFLFAVSSVHRDAGVSFLVCVVRLGRHSVRVDDSEILVLESLR